MFTRTKALLAAAAVTVAAGAVSAAPPAPVFVMKAGASDLYEKTSSQIVLGSTHNPEIRRFANMMITDHSKSTAMVKSAAMRAGLHPKPPMLDPMQRKMVADLRMAHGPERDRVYLDQQKQAHQMALALMQDYASTGDVPPLRHAAGDIVPVVQQHIDMLGRMPM
jgi:putative membrane protein